MSFSCGEKCECLSLPCKYLLKLRLSRSHSPGQRRNAFNEDSVCVVRIKCRLDTCQILDSYSIVQGIRQGAQTCWIHSQQARFISMQQTNFRNTPCTSILVHCRVSGCLTSWKTAFQDSGSLVAYWQRYYDKVRQGNTLLVRCSLMLTHVGVASYSTTTHSECD